MSFKGLRESLIAALIVSLGFCPLARAQQQSDPPSLTTDDVLTIEDAASFEYSRKRHEARERAFKESMAKASKGYRRVVTPSGFAFERPETWQPVENLEASGAPSGFKSEAIFQDSKTGAALTAMSLDRAASADLADITDKAKVDSVLNSMLNPGGDPKANVKILRRESGELPATGVQWVRVKAEGVSQAENGGTVPATYWVQMAQTKGLLAVVAVAYPSDQKAAAVPAYHSVRTLEVLDVPADTPEGEQPATTESAPATPAAEAPKADGEGSLRKP
jgi:hypothetical protein